MSDDRFREFPTSLDRAHQRANPPVARGLLLAGVAAAGLMGVGLGLWARPAMSERRMAAAAEAPAAAAQLTRAPRRQIQIVVDDSPAPVGAPIEVLPEGVGEPVQRIDRAVEAEPLAPLRPAQGLTRVLAPMPAPAAVSRKPVVKRATPEPHAEKQQVARAKPVHGKAELQLAKATPKARRAPTVQLAKAAPAKRPPGLARLFAGLTPHPDKAQRGPRLEKVRFDRHAKPASRSAAFRKATVGKAAHEAQTSRKPVRVEKVVAQKPRPTPRREAPAPATRPSGLMKVANRSRCGQSDPGAAVVCADPSLGAADRQLSRAYSVARAAGVSDAQLQHQQQRWLAARSAAAREAPWAVHDVYLARIAELNGLAREAHAGN